MTKENKELQPIIDLIGYLLLPIIPTILYWIVVIIAGLVLAVVVLAVAAIIIAGIVALYAAKSAKALVTERRAMPALWYSVVAAAGLSGAVMLSSVTILASSPPATEFLGIKLVTPPIESVNDVLRWLLILVDDSVAFFIRLVPICFLANRIFIAREVRGFAWLGVVPPIAAMVTFSIAVHYDDVVAILQNPSREVFVAIADQTLENLSQPFQLAALGLRNPDALLSLLKQEFVTAWPNLFKLAHFYPTAFFLYGAVVAGRALSA